MKAAALAVAFFSCAFFVALSGHAEEGAVSALSPPPLSFTVTPGAAGGPWKLRIENTGDVPVRIAADPRLLTLEVTPPAGTLLDPTKRITAKQLAERVTVRCALPADARPGSDEGHDLVLPGKRSWTTTFDPLFYCFGPRERRALVTGASVKPRFGWTVPAPKAGTKKPAPLAAPFAAVPVGAAVGRVAAAKELEGAPFALTEDVLTTSPPAPVEPTAPGRAVLIVSMPETRDAAKGVELESTVTVVNEGDKAAILLFRPQAIRFSVSGPLGAYACGTGAIVESPIRELYTTIGVKGRASQSLLLTATCPPDTFDEPGIYRVTAVLDTANASARSIGLKTWDGEATARTPMLLRVRTSRRPTTSNPRPTLD